MKRTFAVVFAAMLAYAPLQAQGALIQFPAPSYGVVTARLSVGAIAKDTASTVREMKGALRDLVTAEERYFSYHTSYTADVTALALVPQHGQVLTRVTFVGPDGWAGTATEPSLKGRNCVIYVGPVNEFPNGVPKTTSGIEATKEGVPVCDTLP